MTRWVFEQFASVSASLSSEFEAEFRLISQVLQLEFTAKTWLTDKLTFLETSEALFAKQQEEGKEIYVEQNPVTGTSMLESVKARLETLDIDLKAFSETLIKNFAEAHKKLNASISEDRDKVLPLLAQLGREILRKHYQGIDAA